MSTRAERIAAVAKALSDPIRVQILELLEESGGELCQCNLSPRFPVSQPTMSHHLRKLTDAGLVDVDRRGRWAYYSSNAEALEELRSWLSCDPTRAA